MMITILSCLNCKHKHKICTVKKSKWLKQIICMQIQVYFALVMHGCILSFLLGLLSNEFYFKTSAFFMRYISTRRPVPSTDQAIPCCFNFRISWILVEQRCFYFFLSPRVSGGPQKPQTLTASKSKYEKFGQKI